MAGTQGIGQVMEPSDPSSRPSVRHSVPRVGRPFTTEAARWNQGVLRAEELLAVHLSEPLGDDPLSWIGASHASASKMPSAERPARRLVAAWLAGNLVDDLTSSSSLTAAETWFSGSTQVSAALPAAVTHEVEGLLAELVARPGALEMLPYALDPVPHAYRRDLLRDQGTTAARKVRKKLGSFFTPADVAEHIVDLTLDRIDVFAPELTVLDPAVGTGVFLRASLAGLVARGMAPDVAVRSLHGIDLDECCVDMCAFVLLVDWLRLGSRRSPGPVAKAWQGIRNQLIAGDTLRLLNGAATGGKGLHPNAAPAWAERGFTALVGNPPYARLGSRKDLAQLRGRYRTLEGATAATDIYVAFAELLCSQLRLGGAGSVVVPMSVAYSSTSAPRRFRETADEAGGDWLYQFFDRTPDALFGDDIKQRSAIVTRTAKPQTRVLTGPVTRWSSQSRGQLFERITSVDLGDYAIAEGVPKLGTTKQAQALAKLRATDQHLRDDLMGARKVVPPIGEADDSTVYVAGTGYNWLSVYRESAAISTEADNPSRSGVLALRLGSSNLADATYAILCSRLSFWLWRVEGDAFHVPSGWVRRLPIAPGKMTPAVIKRLGKLGVELWNAVADHPVVSLNGGRTTISYCPHQQPELLDAIDHQLLDALDLPTGLTDELSQFIHDLATAGRVSSSGQGLQRAFAAWKAS